SHGRTRGGVMKRVTRMLAALAMVTASAAIVPAAQAAWSTQLLDGAGATAGCATRTADGIGEQLVTASYASRLNVFFYDYTAGHLPRAVPSGPSSAAITVVDGAGGGGGRVNDNSGQEPAATTFNNDLQVFYYDRTAGNLRHARFDGSSWHFEVVDGAGG